jgi:HSP20 family molecular chaperone IbpA
MDAYRRGDEFVASFDLPGLAPGTIDLTVEQNVLTIKHAGADAIMPSAGGPLFDRSSVIGD